MKERGNQDGKDTVASVERYLATGEAESLPTRPTLETGLLYYRHGANRWLWDMNWRLQETALISIGAVMAACLGAAERIYMMTERSGRKREFLPESQDNRSTT